MDRKAQLGGMWGGMWFWVIFLGGEFLLLLVWLGGCAILWKWWIINALLFRIFQVVIIGFAIIAGIIMSFIDWY